MIYWVQVFHFYQPHNQTLQVLEKICNESYRPLLEVLRQNPHIKVTLNVNGVLLDMLHNHGHRDIILNLESLAEKNHAEFTGSGKYHPILPLLPPIERKRQIALDTATGAQYLGQAYNAQGFFPPETCYSDDILPEIITAGYKWVILSGIACPQTWPIDKYYQVCNNMIKIPVFFRDDILSNKIKFKQTSAQDFLKQLKGIKAGKENIYVITALEAETFGHHIPNWEKLFLETIYEQIDPSRKTEDKIEQNKVEPTNIEHYKEESETICPVCGTRFLLVYPGKLPQVSEVTCPNCQAELTVDFLGTAEKDEEISGLTQPAVNTEQFPHDIKTATISELVTLFPQGEVISTKPSSWSTSTEEILAGNPYALWHDKDNEIHSLQWEHLHLCIEIVNKAQECADNDEGKYLSETARELLDMAEYSCHFEWASHRSTRDINLIQLGLIDQWRAITDAYRAIKQSGADDQTKADYYQKVTTSRVIREKIADHFFTL